MFLSKNEIQNFQSKISKRRKWYDLNTKFEEPIIKAISNNRFTSDDLESLSKRRNQLEKETLNSTPSSAQKITQSHVRIPNHFVAKENLQSEALAKPEYVFVSNNTCRYHVPRYIDLLGMLLVYFLLANSNFI